MDKSPSFSGDRSFVVYTLDEIEAIVGSSGQVPPVLRSKGLDDDGWLDAMGRILAARKSLQWLVLRVLVVGLISIAASTVAAWLLAPESLIIAIAVCVPIVAVGSACFAWRLCTSGLVYRLERAAEALDVDVFGPFSVNAAYDHVRGGLVLSFVENGEEWDVETVKSRPVSAYPADGASFSMRETSGGRNPPPRPSEVTVWLEEVRQGAPASPGRLRTAVRSVRSGDKRTEEKLLEYLRRVVSKKEPQVDDVIAAGALTVLVAVVADENDAIRHRTLAAWALTNVAAGTETQTAAVINSGAMPVLVKTALESDAELSNQVRAATRRAEGNRGGGCTPFALVADRPAAFPRACGASATLSARASRRGTWPTAWAPWRPSAPTPCALTSPSTSDATPRGR